MQLEKPQTDSGVGRLFGDAAARRGSRVRDARYGMRHNSAEGQGRGLLLNPAVTEEVSLELGSGSAESELGGVQVNLIPKDGSNTFNGYFLANFSNSSLQGSNLTDALKARGLDTANAVDKIWDVTGALGGPIIRDKFNPTKFGQVNNLVTFAKDFGTQTRVFNGADFTLNARAPNGAFAQGGLSTGHTATSRCFVVDSPQELLNCKVTPPWLTQIKVFGLYPLPWDLAASATFQTLHGVTFEDGSSNPIAASYTATNAQIAPSLGRNLAAGVNGTATFDLIAPATVYEDRLYQLDLRLTKIVRVGQTRIQGMFDVYDVLNASPILVVNGTYGLAFQKPLQILDARLFKFAVQVQF